MKNIIITLIFFVIVSCSQSENSSINNKPESRFHFSCTPIGWTRNDIIDRAPTKYFNNLVYPSHSLEVPPLWLQKEAITIDFEKNFFDSTDSVTELGNDLIETKIYFNEKTIVHSHTLCMDFANSPKGSCTTLNKTFNRITHQLLITDIDASELQGEKALYECSQVTNLGESWENHRDSIIDDTPEEPSEDGDN